MAIVAVGCVYSAVSSEISGKAISLKYRRVTVTRQDSLSEFRQSTNVAWGASGLFAVLALLSYNVYRKLDDGI